MWIVSWKAVLATNLTLFFLTGCLVSDRPESDISKSPLPWSTDHYLGNQTDRKCGTTRGLFRGSWFDYYERALSFADCGLWQDSVVDLEQALNRRSRDTRNAYEVGMHFSDYFPHRELGIALYHLGGFTEAARELTISLEQFPSSKAEFYLKRTRVKLIEAGNLDKQPPVVVVFSPSSKAVLNESHVEVAGRVTDDSFVETIEVNGVPFRNVKTVLVDDETPVRIERAAPEISFTVVAPLLWQNGESVIRILATDILGKQTEYIHTVQLDQDAPIVSLDQVVKSSFNTIRLKAHVADANSGVAWIKVNDRDIQFPPNGAINLEQKIPVSSGEELTIAAEDRAGNQMQARLPIGDSGAEQSPLHIEIEKGLLRYTHEKLVYLEGLVKGLSNITALTVNGDSLLKQPGRKIFFGFVRDLEVGENMFKIVATDQDGNRQEAAVKIIRDIPSVHTLLERLVVAPLPFDCNPMTQTPCEASAGLYDEVLKRMEARKRFRMIERLKLDDIVHEQIICRSGITERCALAVGNLLFAEGLFVGDVLERINWKGEVSVEVKARMVDVETRDILVHVDAYRESVDREVLKDISRGLVIEISDAFPLVEGFVIDVKGNKLTVDLTGKDRVWEKMAILVYRDEEIIQNRIQNYSKCGEGHLSTVRENASFVQVEEDSCSDIKPYLHKVITK